MYSNFKSIISGSMVIVGLGAIANFNPSLDLDSKASAEREAYRRALMQPKENELKNVALNFLIPLNLSLPSKLKKELGDCPSIERISKVLKIPSHSRELAQFRTVYRAEAISWIKMNRIPEKCLPN